MGRKERRTVAANREDEALATAIESVYNKYGNDLRAFLRDVNAEMTLKRQEDPRAPRMK